VQGTYANLLCIIQFFMYYIGKAETCVTEPVECILAGTGSGSIAIPQLKIQIKVNTLFSLNAIQFDRVRTASVSIDELI